MHARIAIVGRPNVGKSTLFNRLVGKKLALVDDRPGVTRDRREGIGHLGDLEFTIIDTAGLEEAQETSLEGRMRAQTEAAIAEADVIFFLMDARAGLTPADHVFADLVRRSGKPVIVIANKAEGKAGEGGMLEAFALGFGQPIPFSAEHGEGISDLYDALSEYVQPLPDEDEDDDFEEAPDKPMRVAIVGRPNAGKSTLINRLLGEDRLLTGPEAGITRDSISVELVRGDRRYQIFDTAGMRKRAKVEDKLEKLSVADALRAIRFAEVVVVLMDATRPFEEQDLRIADLVVTEGRALVLGMNKWDLAKTAPGAIKRLREEADHWLPQVAGVPIVPISGLMGEGLDKLMGAIGSAYKMWNRRAPTAGVNRWLEEALAANPPPALSGRRVKIRYCTQSKARPPHIVLFGTRLEMLPESYRRYLVNSFRQAFEMPGTPIRLSWRNSDNPYAKKD